MAVFNFKPSSSVKCTASLVSPSWLVSAAHCLVAKHHFTQSSPCLSELPDTGLDIECTKAGNGDIWVNFPRQERGRTSEVLLGVHNINMEKKGEHNTVKLVKRIIINEKGYQGGMYGE